MIDKVFCNIPWFEVHINADGTYHTCGAQPNKISNSNLANIYNVNNLSISDWINSDYQKTARLKKLQGIEDSLCEMCYTEDRLGNVSKRVKENLKSGIHHLHFFQTYNKSPDKRIFDFSLTHDGQTDQIKPNSYHINLGNECNLACRMCFPRFSSRVAMDEYKLGQYTGPIRINWTENNDAWNKTVDYISETEDLKFVHLIGGEPLINPRFENLIDRLLAKKKTDIYFGFTTNGTMLNTSLLDKMQEFRHLDIGISIEGTGYLNDLIRRGSTTKTVLHNIEKYAARRSPGHIYVTVRTVPSAISIPNMYELLAWCNERQLDVFSNFLVNPNYLQIRHLPYKIKQKFKNKYSQWQFSEPAPAFSNPRDPNYYKQHIDTEIQSIIKALDLDNDEELTKMLYSKLEKWGWLSDEQVKHYFLDDDNR